MKDKQAWTSEAACVLFRKTDYSDHGKAVVTNMMAHTMVYPTHVAFVRMTSLACICICVSCNSQSAVNSSKTENNLLGTWERATEYENPMGPGFDPDGAILDGRHIIVPTESDATGIGINFRQRYREFRVSLSGEGTAQIILNGELYTGIFSVADGVLNLSLKDIAGNEYIEKWPYSFQKIDDQELLILRVFYNKLESTRKTQNGYEASAGAEYGPKKLTLMSEFISFRKTTAVPTTRTVDSTTTSTS